MCKISGNLPAVTVIISAMAKLSRKKFGGTLMYELKSIISAVRKFPKNPTTKRRAYNVERQTDKTMLACLGPNCLLRYSSSKICATSGAPTGLCILKLDTTCHYVRLFGAYYIMLRTFGFFDDFWQLLVNPRA